jgi:cellulose synthase/poly-beta-1,6-N-acetylglucosamine synthase-like glycosyltransferase
MQFPKKDLEVIILNDGGNEFDDELNEFINEHGYKKYSQENSGPAAARNYGAKYAKGTYLAFLDDDCIPSSDWLSILLSCVKDAPTSLVGGKIENALGNNIFSEASQMILHYLYAAWEKNRTVSSFFTSNNMIIRKNLFDEIGGFDPNFRTSEDREFCTRWQSSGYQMQYVASAIVHHHHNLSFKSFWNQQRAYGNGLFFYNKKYQHTTKHKRRFESVSFYWNLLVFPFNKMGVYQGAKTSILLLVSQIAIFAGYMQSRFKK